VAVESCARPDFMKVLFEREGNTFKQPVLLPKLSPGSLGTCAVIGSGDNILRQDYGEVIDAHDTVIRCGPLVLSQRQIS
jgi:hypothetical protein